MQKIAGCFRFTNNALSYKKNALQLYFHIIISSVKKNHTPSPSLPITFVPVLPSSGLQNIWYKCFNRVDVITSK